MIVVELADHAVSVELTQHDRIDRLHGCAVSAELAGAGPAAVAATRARMAANPNRSAIWARVSRP
jgi:hypothetical protein